MLAKLVPPSHNIGLPQLVILEAKGGENETALVASGFRR